MVHLNDKQLQAVARFNREYSVKVMTLENEDDKVKVSATLNTRTEKKKTFYLNAEGGLAGIVKDETGE